MKLPTSRRTRPSVRGLRVMACVLGFTLVEVLASVTIIGILIFMAIPSITSVRRDTEENMAISRAEALNMAVSSYIQAMGFQSAKTSWSGAAGTTAADKEVTRYSFLTPYLAYAPTTLADLMPSGYTVTLPTDLGNLGKIRINKPPRSGQTTGDELFY